MSSIAFPTSFSPRIIVADDHEWIRVILVEVVRQTLPTARIIETEDGLQAFKAYRHGGCDLLVSNHHMPHMDGATLIRQVRKTAPALPILMVSVKPEARIDAQSAGANWFLLKAQIIEHLPPLLRLCTKPGFSLTQENCEWHTAT